MYSQNITAEKTTIQLIEEYIVELEVDSKGKLKKELVVDLKESLDKIINDQ